MLLGGWSSWANLASPVSGHCASQQRTRSYALSWLYTDRLDNCNGVGPLSCPSPLVENREKDIRPPSITCHNSISVPTDPGKPTAKSAKSKEFIVSSVPHEVRYTATDAAGLSASCTLQITVSDKERPRVSSCPPDIKKQTSENEIRVTWDYPVFEDNFDRPPVQLRISSNRNPGILYPWGRYQVVYTASDRARNEATCEFYVEVGPVACTYFEAPAYGVRTCNKQTTDSNGVTYEMICAIQCRDGYSFAEPATANTYMCQSDGTWYKLYGQLVPVFPKSHVHGPTVHPSKTWTPRRRILLSTLARVPETNQEVLARIRENFLNAVKNSPLADYLLCDVSKGQDCVVENVKVYCGLNSRKRSLDANDGERIITFDFVIRDKQASSDRKVEAAKLKKMMQELEILDKFIKESFPNNANMPGLQVSSAASSAACPIGKVVIIAPVECPAGSNYNRHSQTCENCQEGSFQNRTGQLSCDACPAGKWSVGGHAKNFTECIVTICEPGEYTMHGDSGISINCLMCPIGTYQPKNYNASKYSSSCGNTLGDFLKNTTNGTNTSSSGFSSTETNLCRQGKDQQPTASDLNSRSFTKQTSADVNSSGCKETAAGWGDHRQHRRRGSNSVTKILG
ncbi:Coagulation factor 5/8 C-terminal domain, discoidin domain [Desmophyllum pertusum]|uniref:Coagulation factor 5/8 C-terminal domain, discoidin domain n=1 Tax=Desmophyllum pertusum TaxID=174260 RepID=A0A9X0DCG3_9CNID|nr:Coagulation factor 5/8 C-terminal domain, discoidin domain [Desmophyllum pertusum]